MQKIHLTAPENTIHVDEISVLDGIFGLTKSVSPYCFLHEYENRIKAIYSDGQHDEDSYKTIAEFITEFEGSNFYHIPTGKRIVTEKVLTVDDLKDTDHVGFTLSGDYESPEKGYIINNGDGYMPISSCGTEITCNAKYFGAETFDDIGSIITKLTDRNPFAYKFSTRKELYKWLSE